MSAGSKHLISLRIRICMFLLRRGELRRGFICLTSPGRSLVNFLAMCSGFFRAFTLLRKSVICWLDRGPGESERSFISCSLCSELASDATDVLSSSSVSVVVWVPSFRGDFKDES